MKFKVIFIVFNVVIVLSFLFIFLMPLVLLGRDYFVLFLSRNWFAGVLFAATLAAINVYFGLNWKLFTLLEREDWPALISHLEERVYGRGSLRRSHLRMLINACLVSSRMEKIGRLEEHLRTHRPGLLKEFALQFGIPYLLRGEPEGAERYFAGLLSQEGVRDRSWIRWNHAFSLMQQKRYEPARETLLGLLEEEAQPVLRLLTLYMLDSYAASDPGLRERVEEARRELAGRFDRAGWQRRLERERNIEVMILSQIIRDATEWLFQRAGEQGAGEPAAPEQSAPEGSSGG